MSLSDGKHFKRNVEGKLRKWGYGFEYASSGVTIQKQPETAEERLKEILIRRYGISIQIDLYSFACFIAAFFESDAFRTMPWEERAALLKREYNVNISDRTLLSWSKKLLLEDLLVKSRNSVPWKTEIGADGQKRQSPVRTEAEHAEMRQYYQEREEIVREETKRLTDAGEPEKAARSKAWSTAYKVLWARHRCCYYYCKEMSLSAFTQQDSHEDLREIYQLSAQISARRQSPEVRSIFEDLEMIKQLEEKDHATYI